MAYITEPTMQELLWTWLTDQGYEVWGEVSLSGNGIIDLVGYLSSVDSYIGIELKDVGEIGPEEFQKKSALVGNNEKMSKANPERENYNRPWEQLARYQSTNKFDKLYFGSQEPDLALNNASSHYVEELYADLPMDPSFVGGIKIPNIFDHNQITIERDAISSNRDSVPAVSIMTEPWIQHQVWDAIPGTKIREAVLPNQTTRTVSRIDIMSFIGSLNPTDVYYNQPDEKIIGVEVKGEDGIPGKKEAVQTQLKQYLESGAITHLSLAVPETARTEAEEILQIDTLNEVGLHIVDQDGSARIIEEPSFVPLKYDGLRTRYGNCIDIGWGRYESPTKDTDREYASIFDMAQSF